MIISVASTGADRRRQVLAETQGDTLVAVVRVPSGRPDSASVAAFMLSSSRIATFLQKRSPDSREPGLSSVPVTPMILRGRTRQSIRVTDMLFLNGETGGPPPTR